MVAQPASHRRAGWLALLYLLAAMAVLVATIASAMDFLHGGRVIAPAYLQVVTVAGLVVGIGALCALLLRRQSANGNVRVAILCLLFGLLLFGSAAVGSFRHPATAPASVPDLGGTTVG